MKNKFWVLVLLIAFAKSAQAQIKYVGKVEIGYLKYKNRLLDVDPGVDWRGYNLNNKQSGLSISSVNGISLLKERLNTGIGVGYLNFQGISGISVFSDIEYLPFNTKLTPIFNLRLGFTHIWNQYDNGTATALGDFGLGLNYRLIDKLSVYIRSGIALTQQASFTPINFGIRF